LQIASREADEDYPFGYGRAEPLAAAIVGLILIAAGVGIAIAALREIRTPHYAPEPYTLVVLLGVIVTKEALFRRMRGVATATDSSAVHADAWHHRSDAITSLAAFIGISLALWKGQRWASADDWAALVASAVILVNALRVARPAIAELMDRSPERPMVERLESAARGVSGVRGDAQTQGAATRRRLSRRSARAGGSNPNAARGARLERESEECDSRDDTAGRRRARSHGAGRS